ncbi:MAG TPA: hypothetical protein PK198_02520, partial [Saprospiraceae bacterium]|nr:hypothetical protein [Saprospiraceae bacterium]
MKRGKADAVFSRALNFYQPSECFNEMEAELKWGVPAHYHPHGVPSGASVAPPIVVTTFGPLTRSDKYSVNPKQANAVKFIQSTAYATRSAQ